MDNGYPRAHVGTLHTAQALTFVRAVLVLYTEEVASYMRKSLELPTIFLLLENRTWFDKSNLKLEYI